MTLNRIKARPTTYKGIEMRSRLEARFAALFDRLELPWAYEPICFANERGQYLPDFELRGIPRALGFEAITDGEETPCYVEVKPDGFNVDAVRPRMEIVWSSQPDAHLLILTPSTVLSDGLFPNFPLGHGTCRVPRYFGDADSMIQKPWWTEGWFGRCVRCEKASLYEALQAWLCHRCGYADGDGGWKSIADDVRWHRDEIEAVLQ